MVETNQYKIYYLFTSFTPSRKKKTYLKYHKKNQVQNLFKNTIQFNPCVFSCLQGTLIT